MLVTTITLYICIIGTKEQCLEYIEKVWTDMRPKSLRDEMASWPEEELFKGIDMEMMQKIIDSRDPNSTENQFRGMC